MPGPNSIPVPGWAITDNGQPFYVNVLQGAQPLTDESIYGSQIVLSDDWDQDLILKTSPNTKQVIANWKQQLIREAFRLPAKPQQEPAYVETFIVSQNLKPKKIEFPFIDPKAHVGIEVEVENVAYINPNIPLCFWQIDEDGSLRNHGKEFKTYAIPMKHAQIALEHLFDGLNPDIDFSHRTSIHVHLDVRGLTFEQLLTLLFTYSVMENLLFKFAGASRRNNIFCTPITETRLFHDLSVTSKNSLRDHFTTIWQKYSALNLIPISQFGTVEFRQMPGTRDITKLCIWLDLLARIRLFAYRKTLTEVLDTIGELNTNSQYRRFVEAVFGELTVYLDTTSLLQDMEKAVYICKNCTAVNEFHQLVLKSPADDNMLIALFGKVKSLEAQLGKEMYSWFAQLHDSIRAESEEASYNYIRACLPDYHKAFPNFGPLFAYIKEHPL